MSQTIRAALLGCAILTVAVLAPTTYGQSISANINVLYADKVDEPVVFDGSGSTGVAGFDDGTVEWDFGDGFTAKIIRATHVYRKAGTYTVRLTVKDSGGNTSTTTTPVTVANIPAASNTLTVVTDGSGNNTTTFNTVQAAVNMAATLNGTGSVEILLTAGDVFDGPITLTVPTGNNYITIRSTGLANLPQGRRVDRSTQSEFATIQAPNSQSAVETTITGGVPSHHYRFQGVQFRVKPGVAVSYSLLILGLNVASQDSVAKTPHHFIIDRCQFYAEDIYITGTEDYHNLVQNGLNLNARNTAVLDSDFRNLNWPGVECHAIVSVNGTQAVGITNNYLESGSLNVLFGGAIPFVSGSITQDVEFRRNRSHRPVAKQDLPYEVRWSSKNNLEFKAAQYVTIDGNLFDGNWIGWNQQGPLVVINVNSDTGPQSASKDIQFTLNRLTESPNGLWIAGTNSGIAFDHVVRILVKDNLFTDIGGTTGGPGRSIVINQVPIDLKIRHNTLLASTAVIFFAGEDLHRPIVFESNVSPTYIGGDGQLANGAINLYAPGSTFRRNVIAGASCIGTLDNCYPVGTTIAPANISDHFVGYTDGNYHLVSTSPVRQGQSCAGALDCNDGGANINALNRATRGTISGLWRNPVPSDFDGDGKSDIAVWRPSNTAWYILQSSTGTLATYTFGSNGDVLTPGDYDGDGKTDVAVFRPSAGTWFIIESSTLTTRTVAFGSSSDLPSAADYDGDGKTDVAYFRPSTGGWYVKRSGNSTLLTAGFGTSGDKPVVGDYDNDGRADFAVFRPSTNNWHVYRSSDGSTSTFGFGSTGDKPAQGNYDGDGKTDYAVFRPSTNAWYVWKSSTATMSSYFYGSSGDVLAPAEFDGDGWNDIAIFRPTTGNWHYLATGNGVSYTQPWGSSGDVPVPTGYLAQ